MNKNLAINSGDLRLCKTSSGRNVIVLVLFAEMSTMLAFTGWWHVLGDMGDGFKQYLMPSHRLHNLIHEK